MLGTQISPDCCPSTQATASHQECLAHWRAPPEQTQEVAHLPRQLPYIRTKWDMLPTPGCQAGPCSPAEQTTAGGPLGLQSPSPPCLSGAECAAEHRTRPSPSASHSPAQHSKGEGRTCRRECPEAAQVETALGAACGRRSGHWKLKRVC